MAPRPGSHTAVMSDSLNLSTSTAFALSLTSTSVNSSQMSRSLNKLNSPAMKPCYWSTSFDGLVTYPEWRTTASLRWSSMVNSPLAIVTGAPKKCYKDCFKKSLSVCHIDCQQWSDIAADRDAWRHTVHKAASQFEENQRDSLKDKRQKRKAQAASTTENTDLTYMCQHCMRTCPSRISLLSHEWACSQCGQQPSWSSCAKPSQTNKMSVNEGYS